MSFACCWRRPIVLLVPCRRRRRAGSLVARRLRARVRRVEAAGRGSLRSAARGHAERAGDGEDRGGDEGAREIGSTGDKIRGAGWYSLLGAPGTSIGREGMCDRFQARKEQQRTLRPPRGRRAARPTAKPLKILRSSLSHSTSTGLARLTSFRPPFGAAFVIVGCAAAAWAAATSAAYT